MSISAKIILDSVNPFGERITTWILTYPRFIHAEFMTHRVFSRNASSSRAIPIGKALESVAANPAVPEYWGANQKGMQAAVELEGEALAHAKEIWQQSCDAAIKTVQALDQLSVHKQIASRIVEPWNHITVLATATDYTNFFSLRAHKDAQPEFQVLAYTMLKAYVTNVPKKMTWGEWHIPFGEQMPDGITTEDALKVATARAARLSYKTFEGIIDVAKDIELHDRLAQSGHWSPFEHCAYACEDDQNSNFRGWQQYRKQFSTENPITANYAGMLAAMPNWVHNAILRNEEKS